MFIPSILIFLSLAVCVSSTPASALRRRVTLEVNAPITDEWSEFNQFVEKFSKKYESMEELEARFAVFKVNLRNIIMHNMNPHNYTLGINQFADLTPQEFKEKFVSGMKGPIAGYGCKSFSSSASSAPSTLDWRTKNAVTSVKNQGQCGSCWTFSATGAIEGAWAISTGKLVDFSEQELVDCATGTSYGSHGCNGGQMDGAFKFVIEHGQCTLADYPYTSGVTKTSGTCNTKCTSVAHLSACADVKANDQISLKGAVSMQPVSIAIEADTKYFQSYSGGILDSTACGTALDHGVLVVGYGVENGVKYWIVKNSWGETWGEHGYVRILRSDSTSDAGICGIAMSPSFPIV